MKTPKSIDEFDHRDGKCPICKRAFRSDVCAHSYTQVEHFFEHEKIRQIVRDEVDRYLRSRTI